MKNLLATILVMTLSGLTAMAQFITPPAAPPDVLDNPIDGGLSLLLGAGVAYGAKKLRDYRRNQQEDNGIEGE